MDKAIAVQLELPWERSITPAKNVVVHMAGNSDIYVVVLGNADEELRCAWADMLAGALNELHVEMLVQKALGGG